MMASGEVLRVHPGHIGMLEGRVQFGITTLRGVCNIFSGVEGLFVAELTGPVAFGCRR